MFRKGTIVYTDTVQTTSAILVSWIATLGAELRHCPVELVLLIDFGSFFVPLSLLKAGDLVYSERPNTVRGFL